MSSLEGSLKKIGRDRESGSKFRSLSKAMQTQRDSEPYRSFEELSACHVAGRDYVIETRRGERRLLVAAWHGGAMERGSDILADAVADTAFDYYAFKATIPHAESGAHPLHITSGRFNEPTLLNLAAESERVLSVHCCNTSSYVERIFIGGGAECELRESLVQRLRSSGFNSGPDKLFPGHHHRNPCNLGKRFGIQIEIPQEYMNKIIGSEGQFRDLAAALRSFMFELGSA